MPRPIYSSLLLLLVRPLPRSTLFPYTTLFRSQGRAAAARQIERAPVGTYRHRAGRNQSVRCATRSEEHTSELQSRENLVCRLLLEKKKAHDDLQSQAGVWNAERAQLLAQVSAA